MTKPFFSQVRSFAPQKAVKSEGRGDRLDSFTLIELMVVLALIGIMTALIIPQMKGTYQDAVLRSTGRQLVDVLSLAGSRAITLSQPMRVHIEPRKSHYFVQKGGPARQKSTAEVDFPGGEGEINKQ